MELAKRVRHQQPPLCFFVCRSSGQIWANLGGNFALAAASGGQKNLLAYFVGEPYKGTRKTQITQEIIYRNYHWLPSTSKISLYFVKSWAEPSASAHSEAYHKKSSPISLRSSMCLGEVGSRPFVFWFASTCVTGPYWTNASNHFLNIHHSMGCWGLRSAVSVSLSEAGSFFKMSH